LKMLPKAKTMILGCVDPRVDPAHILGLEPAEAAIIRNIGGRVTPATLLELDLLRGVAQASGGDFADGWNLIVLQHTDCGITRLDGKPEQLARYLDQPASELAACHVHDPRRAVVSDIEALRAHRAFSEQALVTGLVYDVATGRVETVVPTAALAR